jgi:hypothetical protein
VLSYPSGITVSSRALGVLSDALRAPRKQRSTRWRKLSAGRQALLVVAYLRKGETYADLATGFGIGTTTVFRYVQEALEVLAALAPSLRDAVAVAVRKTFVILDGTLLRIDRVGMGSGRDRPYFSGGVGDDLDATPWVLCFPEPGARHDMGAAREHGILDALTTAGVRVIADNGYRGSGFAVPQRRRAADPETGERRRLSRNQKAVNSATPANAAPVNGPTPC